MERIKRVFLMGCAVGASTISTASCGAEMVRPRASGEPLDARPERALVVGQFDVAVHGIPEEKVGLTRHRVVVGEDTTFFTEEVAEQGRVFALWVYPGVFCLGRPTYKGKSLGKGAACVEIPEAGKAYYVGSVVWTVKKAWDGAKAELTVEDRREFVAGSKMLVGIYPDPKFVSEKLDAEEAAKKHKLP